MEVAARVAAGVTAPALVRGELTVPGDHPIRTAEYATIAHVNRDGFVDREWGPRGGPRVIVIGDSFVQAAQVALEEGFGRRLASAAGVEVLSMGVPGAGTGTALGVLEQYALPREPDVVILGFLVANDVLNNHPLLEGKDDKPFFALRDGVLVPRAGRSAALSWIARTWAARAASRDRIARGGGLPIDLRVHDPGGGAVWEEAWAVTDALVGAMAARCADAGVRFGTILFPDAVTGTMDGRALAGEAWPAVRGWDFDRATGRAASIAGKHGPVLDLAPAFMAATPPLFFPRDGHWTAEGHALAAERSAEFVRGLLP